MAKRKKKPAPVTVIEPTEEQFATGTFERAGLAYRRKPVIDTLFDTGKINRRQFDGLARYRDIAIAEDRSPMRDSLDKALHGRSNGNGHPPALVRVAVELGRLERELGSLRAIARAVAVDDVTVSQWAMQQSGSVMRTKEIGRTIVKWFEPRRKFHEAAMIEIRFAGDRLAAAIGA
jgi:hypothetical protein